MCPLLIQNAAKDPKLRRYRAVLFGLTRYLGVPIFNPEGAAIGTLCFHDGRSEQILGQEDVEFMSLLAMRVSTELERERAIAVRIAEERAMVERLAEMNAQLQRTAEEKRRFIAAVVHDLRQPLAALRTTLYLLRDEDDPDERRECLGVIENRTLAISAMVDEFLEYAQIEAGHIPWRIEQVDLKSLLTEDLDGFAPDAQARGVRLRRELEADLGWCRTDPTKLRHVVGNLVSNAIKFSAPSDGAAQRMRPSGTVVVRARCAGDAAWRLEVEDNGVGMAESDLARIFDEFYQGAEAGASEARSGYPRGRGLGLSIVHHLCSAMHAQIDVRSRPGKGTCFTITFPREHPVS